MTAQAQDPLLAWLEHVQVSAEAFGFRPMHAALRREVEAHPAESNWRPHWPYSVGYCRACEHPVPCPTRSRIAEELGVAL